MRLKNKVGRLEKRLGIWHCPHGGGALPPPGPEAGTADGVLTDTERLQAIGTLLGRYFSREQVLAVLAVCHPDVRAAVADVYPLSAAEQGASAVQWNPLNLGR